MLALEHLFLWFVLYSFIGWIYESILVSVMERRLVNRGFLDGPLCPIYGAGAALAIALLHNMHNPITIFLISAIGASVLEYVTSWAMEKMFHARWWDYSDYRFNLQGRICLLGALVFGIAGVAIIDIIQPQVAIWTMMIPLPVVHWLCSIFTILIIIDTSVTVMGIVDLGESLSAFGDAIQSYAEKAGDSWQWGRDAFVDKVRGWSESSQEIISKIQNSAMSMLNRQQRRMISAFPHMKSTESTKYSKIMETVREMLRRRQ